MAGVSWVVRCAFWWLEGIGLGRKLVANPALWWFAKAVGICVEWVAKISQWRWHKG